MDYIVKARQVGMTSLREMFMRYIPENSCYIELDSAEAPPTVNSTSAVITPVSPLPPLPPAVGNKKESLC